MEIVVRSLNVSEEDVWLDFVSSVFIDTPRDYFYRHIHNDPDQQVHQHIFVALEDGNTLITQTSQILGTLRVFQRSFLHYNDIQPMGGIGEVSVSPSHRRKGIATKLLHKAIQHMKEGNPKPISAPESKMPFIWSSLHTGEAAPLYRTVGYQSMPLSFSTIEYKTLPKAKKDNDTDTIYRHVDFDADIAGMKQIYHEYCGHFVGCFTRQSDYYWEHWVHQETPRIIVATSADSKSIKGMLGGEIKKNENGTEILLIKDFGVCSSSFAHDYGETMFIDLLLSWVNEFCPQYALENSIVLPSAVCAHWKDVSHCIHEVDEGVMYLKLNMANSKGESTNIVPLDAEKQGTNHLFWSTDAF